jgi:sulfate/thiosulfate transport system ATP-binding protein
MSIQIIGLTKRFGDFTAVDDVSLAVATGELVALLGPSGSGKTTLLRLIAGLEFPEVGRVLFEGVDATLQSSRERHVGFVFQHYALFRHMSVFENVAFGLRVKRRHERPGDAEIRERVMRLLELVHLAPLAGQYPAQLSGGQRQRVALARALAIEPKLLLLDEPFGALDAQVRKELRRWLRRLHSELHVTSLFVTHDQEEALELADRVVIMNQGRIEQIGSPGELDEEPASGFVLEFLGHVNRFAVRWTEHGAVLGAPCGPEQRGRAALAYVRPHELELVAPEDPSAIAVLVVQHVMTRGGAVRLELEGPDDGVAVELEGPRHQMPEGGLIRGERVGVRASRVRIVAVDGRILPADPAPGSIEGPNPT